MEVAKEGIDAPDKIADSYNTILDNVVPLKQIFSKVNQYQSDYSKEANALVTDANAKVTDGLTESFKARYKAWEICAAAIPLLTTYNHLLDSPMDQGIFSMVRTILINVLNIGIQKLEDGQKDLADSSASFDAAAGKLMPLNTRLESDFSENSEYFKTQIANIRKTLQRGIRPFFLFGVLISRGASEAKVVSEVKAKMAAIEKSYQELTAEARKSSQNIDATRAKIKEQIREIIALKDLAEGTKTFEDLGNNPELKESVLKSSKNLIAKCSAYQVRHVTNL